MIDLNDADRVVAFWFVSGKAPTGASCDWLSCLYRARATGKWRVTYRFRYHRDDRAHDSDDEKHWYVAESDGAEDEAAVMVKASQVADLCAQRLGGPLETVLVRGDAAEAVRLLSMQPWASFRPAASLRHDG